MRISEWLDQKEAEGADVSQILLPEYLSYDELPDETVFFKEIIPCGILCTGDHPFSIVERFGHWYFCRGQDKEEGFTHPARRSGDCLQRIKISLSTRLNHT